MKINNLENGRKKVYVQMNDIAMLNHTDISIPTSILKKISTDVVTVNDSNRMDFVEFTEPNEIEFFENLDWIIDYKQIRYLSEKEIKSKEKEIANEMNKIANIINSMTEDERKNKQFLIQKYELLDYKKKCLAEILLNKQESKQILFPVVPDSDGFSFVGDDEYEYEIRASLDPNKILLFRKDGKKLSNDDRISREFFQMGISIAIMERNKQNAFVGDYEMSKFLTEDNQHLIVEFKVKSYEEQEKKQKEEKGIKRLAKRLFNMR